MNVLTWWTEKHNGYATREMVDMLMMEYGMDDKAQEIRAKLFGTEEQRKRWLKMRYVHKAPLFVRPLVNFLPLYPERRFPRRERRIHLAHPARVLVQDAGGLQDI